MNSGQDKEEKIGRIAGLENPIVDPLFPTIGGNSQNLFDVRSEHAQSIGFLIIRGIHYCAMTLHKTHVDFE